MNKIILILLGLLAVIGVVAGALFWMNNVKLKPQPVGCTQEAKVCPDGSSVGRTGLNCEFAQCPVERGIDTSAWVTYTSADNAFTFKYPANFGANVWRPTQWPPLVVMVPAGQDPVAIGCPDLPSSAGIAMMEKKAQRQAALRTHFIREAMLARASFIRSIAM
jgi:hypothetical protein